MAEKKAIHVYETEFTDEQRDGLTVGHALAHVEVREQWKWPIDLPMARELVAEIHRLEKRVAELEQERGYPPDG